MTRQDRHTGKRPPPVGWIHHSGVNLISIVVYLLLTSIVVLVIWRITGYQPFQQASSPGSSPSRTYTLLGAYQEKLYFFDQQSETVHEYDPTQPDIEQSIGSLPSVEAVFPSPQADRIAIVSAAVKGQTGIYVLDLSSPVHLQLVAGQQTEFIPGYTLMPTSAASWSPDGRDITFVAYKDGESDLFVANADGTGVQRLTYLGANIGSLAWVDRDTIAFVSDWEGRDTMYFIESDGGNLRRAK